MKKVFIDGSAGTTGLKIYTRLKARSDIELLLLDENLRKDPKARKNALNSCDVAFLCLPDAAAIEAAHMLENENVVVLDTSTAHRTAPGWAYGFPELSADFEQKIKCSNRIAVPGCHASGFIALVYPLVKNGILPKTALLTCHSVTGYSGGGKKMIAQYEDENRDGLLGAPRQYGLSQEHKHLPEMKKITGLDEPPVFCPIVSDFYSGMVMTVPLFARDIGKFTPDDIKRVYSELYSGEIVKYVTDGELENGFISAQKLSGKDSMQISVCGNGERILLIARYDNLGKGASGAAIECMNIAINAEKTAGLVL